MVTCQPWWPTFLLRPPPLPLHSHHKKASCGPNVEYQCKKVQIFCIRLAYILKLSTFRKFYLVFIWFFIFRKLFSGIFLSKWLALALPNKVIILFSLWSSICSLRTNIFVQVDYLSERRSTSYHVTFKIDFLIPFRSNITHLRKKDIPYLVVKVADITGKKV